MPVSSDMTHMRHSGRVDKKESGQLLQHSALSSLSIYTVNNEVERGQLEETHSDRH